MEKAPTISQNFGYNGEWKTLSLTGQELELLRAGHRDHTIETMRQCVKDVVSEMPQIVDFTCSLCVVRSKSREVLHMGAEGLEGQDKDGQRERWCGR